MKFPGVWKYHIRQTIRKQIYLTWPGEIIYGQMAYLRWQQFLRCIHLFLYRGRPGNCSAWTDVQIRDLFQDFEQEVKYEKLKLYPLSVLHISANDQNDYRIVLDLFEIIGVFILIMSAFNYINLTAAKSSTRSKEIAIKKINGSMNISLFFQFLFETVLLAIIALGISVLMAKLILPTFNSIVDKKMDLSLITNSNFIITTCLILLLVGSLAGIYPALLLSSQKILHLIKGEMFGQKVNKLALQKTLVFFQFAISVFLIGTTLFVAAQVKHLINKDLGFNKENILYARINSGKRIWRNIPLRSIWIPWTRYGIPTRIFHAYLQVNQ